MALPEDVISYLNENAKREGLSAPGPGDDLFQLGVLDSFSLVDFVSLLEEQFSIKVPDSDVNPENFRSIQTIEQYVSAHGG